MRNKEGQLTIAQCNKVQHLHRAASCLSSAVHQRQGHPSA